jgi:hypothetical protein
MTLERYSTAALRVAAAAVMRAYLDHDAGHDSGRLRRFLTPEAAAALDEHQPSLDPAAASTYVAIGPYSALRLDADRAYVCAGVLQPDGGEAVLAVELVGRGGALRAARVGRVAQADERQRDSRPRDVALVGDGQPAPDPPAHMRALLGDLPDSQGARERWLLGAAIIDTYRERHDVHDVELALGGQPEEPEQRAERDQAAGYLRELVRQINGLEPDHAAKTPTRDAGRSNDLGR